MFQIYNPFAQILAKLGAIMASITDFKADVLQQIADLKAAAASEHTQVMAAIDALQGQIVATVPDDVVAEVKAAFADAKSAIGGIYEPPTPPPA